MKNENAKIPLIYEYLNYRIFLRDFYIFKKQTSQFSYRDFSETAGFKSPNFIKLVIDGKRNLTAESIRKLIYSLKLNSDEGTFFKNLVLLNQSKKSGEQIAYSQELCKLQVFKSLFPIKVAALEFYQKWYSIPIRELISSPLFKEDPQWISNLFWSIVTPEEVTSAIQNMLLLGLIRRNPQSRLELADKNISTGNEVYSKVVANYHKQMMIMASESIETVQRDQRDISSVTFLISKSNIERLKTLVQDFRKTLLAEASQLDGSQQAVYQLNFQMFPLTAFFDLDALNQSNTEEKCQKVS